MRLPARGLNVMLLRRAPSSPGAAGATIERELTDQDYGSREFTARDPEGNLWSFGTYRPSR